MKLLSTSFALPSLPLLLLLIIQLFQFPATILAQTDIFINTFCPDTITNYTSGSQFDSNLRSLLFPTLISNGSRDSYFNTSYGTGPDTIYGLVQCRFDVSEDDCKSCLTLASGVILQQCPNKQDVIIRLEKCLFRHSNINFFSKKITKNLWQLQASWMWENPIKITDLPVFNKQLRALFTNLTSLASSKPLKYATGKISYGALSNIYGLADCSQDLSSTDCASCLQFNLQEIPYCCSGYKKVCVLTENCQIWYKDIEFFGTPRALPSLPPPPPSTKTSPVSPSFVDVAKDNTKVKSRHSSSSPGIVVIVGPALAGAAVMILLVSGICYMRRKGAKKPNCSEIMDEDIRSTESLQFELAAIKTATKNFSDSHKLGEGGFGEVYKGELPDGKEIAVKRLSKTSGQGLQEFKNEVMLLHKLQHRNLVRLLVDTWAPEYALHGLFSVKTDVFSFGVLVLEIVSGQRITSFRQSNTQENLLSYAWKHWREGTSLVLMDPTLSDSFTESEMIKSIYIGLLCVQEKVENRPTMSIVLSMLNSNSVSMASPSHPAFFADRDICSNMDTITEQESDLYKHKESLNQIIL